MSDLAEVRSWYAEELRSVAAIKSRNVVEAFATVPRERFLGPGPWELRSPYGSKDYWRTEDANAARLYHNVLVAIDSERHLNNGLPSLWAFLFDNVGVKEGERVVHIGAGTGYYSAILAELVGKNGTVVCIEIDSELARRADSNLSGYKNVAAVCADGSAYDFGQTDIIVVSAGATHPLRTWVEKLNGGGRLLVPLTGSSGNGGFLKITREDKVLAANFVSPVGFIPCAGARDEGTAQQLDAAFEIGYAKVAGTVRSLRYDDHPRLGSCWLHRPDFCLSTIVPSTESLADSTLCSD